MAVNLSDLVAKYRRDYRVGDSEAKALIIRDLQQMASEEEEHRAEAYIRRRQAPAPPAAPAVISRVAEALPQPPVAMPVGAYFAQVSPQGKVDPRGWRPPGVTPVDFHRGYWTMREGKSLTLYRSGQPVNGWDISRGPQQAENEVQDWVKRWPIMAERSIIPGQLYMPGGGRPERPRGRPRR